MSTEIERDVIMGTLHGSVSGAMALAEIRKAITMAADSFTITDGHRGMACQECAAAARPGTVTRFPDADALRGHVLAEHTDALVVRACKAVDAMHGRTQP